MIGETASEWAEVMSGVPQGSVLGPLLFVIYINDLPRVLANKCKLYADDSKIKSLADVESIQADVLAISEWARTWLMKLNVAKCKVMHLGKNNPCAKYVREKNEEL